MTMEVERKTRLEPLVWLAALALVAAPVSALSPLASLTPSPDVTVILGGATVSDHQLAADDLSGLVSVMDLGGLPHGAAVDAIHAYLDGRVLFSLATAINLAGTTFGPADVVLWDGAVYTKLLDASAVGLPAGVNLNAVSVDGADLLISFDVTFNLFGSIVADEDLVRWNGVPSLFSSTARSRAYPRPWTSTGSTF